MQPVFALVSGGGGAVPLPGSVPVTPGSGPEFADILAEEGGAGAVPDPPDMRLAEPSVELDVVEHPLVAVPTYWPQLPAVDPLPSVQVTGPAPLPGGDDVSAGEVPSAETKSGMLPTEVVKRPEPVAQTATVVPAPVVDASKELNPKPASALPTSEIPDQRGVESDVPPQREVVPALGKPAAYASTHEPAAPREEAIQKAGIGEATLAAPRVKQPERESGSKAPPTAPDQPLMRQAARPPAFLWAEPSPSPPPKAKGPALGYVPGPAAGLPPGLDAMGAPPPRAAPVVALTAAVPSPVEEAPEVVEMVVPEGGSEAVPAPPIPVSAMPVTFAAIPTVATDVATLLVPSVGLATVIEVMAQDEMPTAADKTLPPPPDNLVNAPAIPSRTVTLMPALPAWLELAVLEQHEEVGEFMVTGPATAGPTSAAPTGVAVQPAPPTPLAVQVLAGLSRHQDGTTEITLSPEELGTVRLRLRPDSRDSERMVVMLSFDRPETMELFRRHADQLAEAIRSSGYAGVDIGFDRGGDSSQGFSGSQRPEDFDLEEPLPVPTGPQPRLLAGAALDLRL